MILKQKLYIPVLDGLRAIAIILVVTSHLLVSSKLYDNSPVPGGLGVTIFFFISGYLITTLLLNEQKKNFKINIKLFYMRRFIRLYPPMLAMILCMTSFLLITNHTIHYKEVKAAFLYYENYYLAYNPSVNNRYSILWSLGVEEHFYLIFPLIFIIFVKNIKMLFTVTALLTVIPLFFRLLIADRYNADSQSLSYTYQLSHCRFDSILYGCLTSIMLMSEYSEVFLKIISRKPVYISAIILFIFCLLFRDEFFRHTAKFSLQGVCCMILVPPILHNKSFALLNKMLSGRVLIFIGKISYSIYLFHYVVIEILRDYNFDNPLMYILINAVLSSIFTFISYYFIETPFLKVRQRFGSNAKVISNFELIQS